MFEEYPRQSLPQSPSSLWSFVRTTMSAAAGDATRRSETFAPDAFQRAAARSTVCRIPVAS